jgi:hypothetical protein
MSPFEKLDDFFDVAELNLAILFQGALVDSPSAGQASSVRQLRKEFREQGLLKFHVAIIIIIIIIIKFIIIIKIIIIIMIIIIICATAAERVSGTRFAQISCTRHHQYIVVLRFFRGGMAVLKRGTFLYL